MIEHEIDCWGKGGVGCGGVLDCGRERKRKARKWNQTVRSGFRKLLHTNSNSEGLALTINIFPLDKHSTASKDKAKHNCVRCCKQDNVFLQTAKGNPLIRLIAAEEVLQSGTALCSNSKFYHFMGGLCTILFQCCNPKGQIRRCIHFNYGDILVEVSQSQCSFFRVTLTHIHINSIYTISHCWQIVTVSL